MPGRRPLVCAGSGERERASAGLQARWGVVPRHWFRAYAYCACENSAGLRRRLYRRGHAACVGVRGLPPRCRGWPLGAALGCGPVATQSEFIG